MDFIQGEYASARIHLSRPSTISLNMPGKIRVPSPIALPGRAHQQLAVEFLAKQVGLKFKHVPFKEGAPACTALIGGHVDFTAGAGIHLQYLKQGTFRMLAVVNADERDPAFPEVPTLKDLGYKDLPPGYYTLVASKGLPASVFKKFETTFREVTYSSEFRKILENLGIPFIFKGSNQLETELRNDYQLYLGLLKDFGIIK